MAQPKNDNAEPKYAKMRKKRRVYSEKEESTDISIPVGKIAQSLVSSISAVTSGGALMPLIAVQLKDAVVNASWSTGKSIENINEHFYEGNVYVFVEIKRKVEESKRAFGVFGKKSISVEAETYFFYLEAANSAAKEELDRMQRKEVMDAMKYIENRQGWAQIMGTSEEKKQENKQMEINKRPKDDMSDDEKGSQHLRLEDGKNYRFYNTRWDQFRYLDRHTNKRDVIAYEKDTKGGQVWTVEIVGQERVRLANSRWGPKLYLDRHTNKQGIIAWEKDTKGGQEWNVEYVGDRQVRLINTRWDQYKHLDRHVDQQDVIAYEKDSKGGQIWRVEDA